MPGGFSERVSGLIIQCVRTVTACECSIGNLQSRLHYLTLQGPCTGHRERHPLIHTKWHQA